jgi:hypothetical protein
MMQYTLVRPKKMALLDEYTATNVSNLEGRMLLFDNSFRANKLVMDKLSI